MMTINANNTKSNIANIKAITRIRALCDSLNYINTGYNFKLECIVYDSNEWMRIKFNGNDVIADEPKNICECTIECIASAFHYGFMECAKSLKTSV